MLDEIDELLLRENSWLREAYEKWKAEAKAKAQKEFLRTLFMRRMKRDLSPAEQEVVAERFDRLGWEAILDAGVALEGDALAAWLLDPAGG